MAGVAGALGAIQDRGHGQAPKREAEAKVRTSSVRLIRDGGLALRRASGLLCVAGPTLQGWKRRDAAGTLGPNMLGRPPYGCDDRTMHEIRDLAWEVGPDVSVEYIKRRLPWVPRSVVERVVRSCKRDFRRDARARLKVLTWERAGRVWSCDWTDADAPIDGIYQSILAVRDLASDRNLQSLPAERKSAGLASDALESLFAAHGCPLVMKDDNGSEFTSEEFSGLMREHGVTQLLSPAYYPPYNGAIEAGIGSLKTHAWYEAARRGRTGCWTCDDVEAGRLKANETARPKGPDGPSPDDMWNARTPITPDERERFLAALNEERAAIAAANEHRTITAREMKADERRAIENALVKCGYLNVTRRRVTLGENRA